MIRAFVVFVLLTAPASAQQYLGRLGGNPYAADSLSNPFGAGNPFRGNSMANPYGRYGNPYSAYSPHNPFSTHAPRVYDDGSVYGE